MSPESAGIGKMNKTEKEYFNGKKRPTSKDRALVK
jgi:hypothetical protein